MRLLIGCLREEGLLDDTILVFTSDHGDMLGHHGLWAKPPMFEWSAKIPMILMPAAGCERSAPDQRDDRLAELRDVMPTLLDLCGLPVPETTEGLSLVSDSRRQHLYCEHFEDEKSMRMVRCGSHKLIWYPVGNRLQLFDVDRDPMEMSDLAADPAHAGVLEDLTRRLLGELYGSDERWVQDGRLAGEPDRDVRPALEPRPLRPARVALSVSRYTPAKRLPALLAALLVAAPLGAAERTLELRPCSDEVDVGGAECGRLEVFEDRESGQGRTIELKVIVLPALGRGAAPDPLFLLAGGPGMPASALARVAQAGLRRVRERREIVLVDQRGTGELSPLRCDDIDADSTYYSFDLDLPVQQLRGCLEAFDADPSRYTTPAAMDDLDDVRRALGYERINLWGGSYGTRAALVYLRRHPERVRSIVLDGVAPTGMRMPLHIGEDARRSVELMLSDCETDPDCLEAFPRVRSRYEELLARLEETPEQVSVPTPAPARSSSSSCGAGTSCSCCGRPCTTPRPRACCRW